MNYSVSSQQNKPYSEEFWQYLKSIAKYPILTAEEEKELAVRARAGDKAAFDRLVNGNLRLSVKFAKKYHLSGIDIFDLVQSGNVGIIKAAKRYDPSSGCRFSTYAFVWIKNEVMRFLASMQYPFSLTQVAYGELWKVIRAAEETIGKPIDKLTNEDVGKISEITGLSAEKIFGALNVFSQFYSIDAEVGDDESMQAEEVIADMNGIAPEEAASSSDFIEKMKSAISQLQPAYQEVINERFGLTDGVPKTLRELGDKIGRSKECVRIKQERALKIIKKEVNKNGKHYYI